MIAIGRTEAKAIENNFFVGQERCLGDQNRLETDVVLSVNDAFQRIFLKGCLSIVIWKFFEFLYSSLFLFTDRCEDKLKPFFFQIVFCFNKKGLEPFIPNG